MPVDRPRHGGVPEPVYKDHRAEVLRGDALLLDRVITDERVDLVVTSPPYALGIDYGRVGYVDDQPYQDYLGWVRTWATMPAPFRLFLLSAFLSAFF